MTPGPLRRVLFVCIGNSCRSQMAEGFARAYGSDVMDVESAGIAPAAIVQPDTVRAMREKNIDISRQRPKELATFAATRFDVVVNMSGYPIAAPLAAPVREWKIEDPIGQSMAVYREVREQIETKVMHLILEFRRPMGSTRRRGSH